MAQAISAVYVARWTTGQPSAPGPLRGCNHCSPGQASRAPNMLDPTMLCACAPCRTGRCILAHRRELVADRAQLGHALRLHRCCRAPLQLDRRHEHARSDHDSGSVSSESGERLPALASPGDRTKLRVGLLLVDRIHLEREPEGQRGDQARARRRGRMGARRAGEGSKARAVAGGEEKEYRDVRSRSHRVDWHAIPCARKGESPPSPQGMPSAAP